MGVLRCALVGGDAMLPACGDLLLERGHEIAVVVSPAEGPREWAAEHGIPAIGFGDGWVDRLAEHRFDHLFSIANLRMLPDRVLALPSRLAVNFHDALLPRHAGVHAAAWAVLEGERRHGVTWHVMTSEADTGDVLVQRAFDVPPDATTRTLDVACFDAGVDSFTELVDALAAGTVEPTPQDLGQRTYHARTDGPPREGYLDLTGEPEVLAALVRSTDHGPRPNPFGTAKIRVEGRTLLVGTAEVLDRASGAAPGSVTARDATTLTVATGGTDVRLGGLTDPAGVAVDPGAIDRLDTDVPDIRPWSELARHDAFWRRRLATVDPLRPPHRDGSADADAGARTVHDVPVPDRAPADPEWVAAAVLAFLRRLDPQGGDVDLVVDPPAPGDDVTSPSVPLDVPALEPGTSVTAYAATVAERVRAARERGLYRRDVRARDPRLRGTPEVLPVTVDLSTGEDRTGADLCVLIGADGRSCRFSSADAALDPTTAGLLAEHAAAFLDAVAGPAGRDLAAVALSSDERRREALVTWNDTAARYPSDRCVHQLVDEQADRTPDATAVVCEGRRLGYAELVARSRDLAARLVAAGVAPGGFVGVLLERSELLPVALLACLRTGAAYVPIDPLYPSGRVAQMLDDAGRPPVLTSQELAVQLPDGTERVLVDAAAGQGTPPTEPVDPEAHAYVIFTSGSTGRPKGVRVRHRNLTNFVATMASEPGCSPSDQLLAVTTVSFDIAALELFVPLVTGGRVEVATDDVAGDGYALRRVLDRGEVTTMQATPATWRMLVDAGWTGDGRLRVLSGGEALPRSLAAALLDRAGEVWNLYGPTETTIWSSAVRLRAGDPVTIGRPIANTRFYVIGPDGGPAAVGLPGELLIGGDGVADGYLDRPELTAQRFVVDPFDPTAGLVYRTGDLVRHRPDGLVEHLGRIDEQVKVRGHRVEPGEVEEALRAHDRVGDAAVRLHEGAGTARLAGYVVAAGDGRAPDPAELREFVARQLPAYMVPSTVTVLDALPRTANGKIDRASLPEPSAPSPPRGAAPAVTGGDAGEAAVAAVWCEVLERQRVGPEENFFDAGGDSLMLMRVMSALIERTGRRLTRVVMFRYPTVRTLARHLESAPMVDPPPEPATDPSPGKVERTVVGTPQPVRPPPGRNALVALRRTRERRRAVNSG